MKKILAVLTAFALVFSCTATMIINASAADETKFEFSKEFASLFLGACPYCNEDISDEIDKLDNSSETLTIKCPSCQKELNYKQIMGDEFSKVIDIKFPEYTKQQKDRIVNEMLNTNKCPDCGNIIVEDGKTVIIGNGQIEESEVAFSSLICDQCGFKASDEPQLEHDIDDVTEFLASEMLKYMFGGDSEDIEIPDITNAYPNAKVVFTSVEEAKKISNVSAKYLSDDSKSYSVTTGEMTSVIKGETKETYLLMINEATFSVSDKDGISISMSVHDVDKGSFSISKADYDMLQSKDELSDYNNVVVCKSGNDYTIYLYKSDIVAENPSDSDTNNNFNGYVSDEDGLNSAIDTEPEEGVITGTGEENNPNTGNNNSISTICILGGIFITGAAAWHFLRKKNSLDFDNSKATH